MSAAASGLDLAVIGNCSYGALIDRRGRVVWSCLPRFDGDPVFCALVAGSASEDGAFEIELLDLARVEQSYRRNSAVLETRLYDSQGGVIEITDAAPRFLQYGRVFRPNMLVRRVSRLAGLPRVRIRIRPRCQYGTQRPEITRGSNHIRWIMPDQTLRLTTDGPVSYLLEEIPFLLEAPIAMILGPDEIVAAPLADLTRELVEKTDEYWRVWCRGLSLPLEWQEAVIRAAITLKLSSYDDTGAIIAAMTSSIPEAADSRRNWDYRFCWLRDSYFVVSALNRLGATRTMELYLGYLGNIVATSPNGELQPVYGILREAALDESEMPGLAGYRDMGPVRRGNKACEQVQNDAYGSVVLACAHSYFDQRLDKPGDEALFRRLERLGEYAAQCWDRPDAGLWELRTRSSVHTHSALLCWAACDRLRLIGERLGLDGRRDHWRAAADRIHQGILARAWSEQLNSFTDTFEGSHVDASLLLIPVLGFLPATDSRFAATLACVEKRLRDSNYLYRYDREDDFGRPRTAFTACTFWYIDALAAVGRVEEARALFENLLARRNSAGLLSEDLEIRTGELWGNIPQTYSMVGLIHSAMRLSKPWEGAF
jgi:GH15 family glucan-1,4-alpha-glucosidase